MTLPPVALRAFPLGGQRQWPGQARARRLLVWPAPQLPEVADGVLA